MILETEIDVVINGTSKEYYIALGYDIGLRKDRRGVLRYEKGKKITVKVNHLPEHSRVKLTRRCELCQKEEKIPYVRILKSRKNFNDVDICLKCVGYKKWEKSKENTAYEKSAEFYCLQNGKEKLLGLYSKDNKFDLKNLTPNSKEKVKWNCEIYGEDHQHIQPASAKITYDKKCPYCCNQKVKIGFNDIWTTSPHLAKLLLNKEEGYLCTSKSSKKLDFKCPFCHYILENRIVYNISRQGLNCPCCKDGISYPEKFMMNLLKQLNTDFKAQQTFKWSGRKKYDFYIPSINAIIETHGKQHYEAGSQFFSQDINKQIANDRLKERMALENNIEHYIIIDCTKSEKNFIKSNIENSTLKNLLDLKDVDWEMCAQNSNSSLVIQAVELWNQNYSTREISKTIGINIGTVITYLKRGEDVGLCTYERYRKK